MLKDLVKIWMQAFWSGHPDEDWAPPKNLKLGPAWVVTISLAAITVAIGLFPEPLYQFAEEAARQMGARP